MEWSGGRVRVRSQSRCKQCKRCKLCKVARGAGRISDSKAGSVLLLRVGGERDSRVQKKRRVALGGKGSAPGKRATWEAVRALSPNAVKRVVTGAPGVKFNRRVCEFGKRLAWRFTEPAAEMWYWSSR